MRPSLRKRLFQAGSFVLAAGLLWLALRGVDFGRVWQDLQSASWVWLLPIVVATLVSHWLRAWRWRLFLETLPEDAGPGGSVSTGSAFSALMIGYMVNYAAPRLGEVVRTANVSSRHGIRFSGVLGTVAAERVLDVIILLVALATVPLVFLDRLGALRSLVQEPAAALADRLPLGLLAALALAVGVIGFLVYRRLSLADEGPARSRASKALRSFADGFGTVTRTPHRAALVGTTIGMWALYGMMAYLPFVLFGYHETFGIGPAEAWGIMLLGAIGVALPSPGGIGSYHYITIQTLVLLFAMPQSEAATYAIVSHAGQLVLYVAVGFIALVHQGAGLASLVRSGNDEVGNT